MTWRRRTAVVLVFFGVLAKVARAMLRDPVGSASFLWHLFRQHLDEETAKRRIREKLKRRQEERAEFALKRWDQPPSDEELAQWDEDHRGCEFPPKPPGESR